MAEVETAQVRARDEPRQAGAAERAAGPLAEAISIMARLRAPGGCPWDREQSFDTIKRYTLEETYEVFDAIERRAWPELKDELGDLLLQVLFYAQMASEAGHFDIADVAANLNAKLVRRHPHVFPVDGDWWMRPTRTRCCATGSRSSATRGGLRRREQRTRSLGAG